MARDYKHRASPKPSPRRAAPGWLWFAGGLLVGLFVAALVYIKASPLSGPAVPAARKPIADAPRAKAPAKEREAETLPPKPRFDFYTVLPEMEVVVPDQEVDAMRDEMPVTRPVPDKAAPKADEAFLLQIGSFRKYAEADRLRASLALIGVEASIQKVSINNTEEWHRVRAGPYESVKRLNDVRKRLKDNGMNAIVIKLKG